MKRWLFTDSSVKEITRSLKVAYDLFHNASKQLVESPDDSVSSDISLEMAFTPWEYYYFRYGSKVLRIHHYKSNHFALECRGFCPSSFKQSHPHSEFEFYRQLYGDFETIDEAIKAFHSAIYQIIGAN